MCPSAVALLTTRGSNVLPVLPKLPEVPTGAPNEVALLVGDCGIATEARAGLKDSVVRCVLRDTGGKNRVEAEELAEFDIAAVEGETEAHAGDPVPVEDK